MKSARTLILITLTIMLLLPSCTKERDPEDILTSTTWRLISYMDLIDPILLLDCDLDDCYSFNSDGTVILDEGPTICDDSESYQTVFSWSLSENGHIITFDGWSCPVDVSEDELFVGCEIFSMTFIPCSSTAYLKESKRRKEILMSHSWKIASSSTNLCVTYHQDGTLTPGWWQFIKNKEIKVSELLKSEDCSFDFYQTFNSGIKINSGFNEDAITWDWSDYGIGWTESYYGDEELDMTYVIKSISKDRIELTLFLHERWEQEPREVVFVPC